MKKAFGLDLAGYSTRKSKSALGMATVSDDGPPTVTILTGSVFAQRVNGRNGLPNHSGREVECLRKLLREGQLFIDVPIGLQCLPTPENPQFVWQLTKRPVDQAFGGMCPLASWIGACVARMENLWRLLKTNGHEDPLGHQMFETYPAGSLKHAHEVHEKYKGKAQYTEQNLWQPCRNGNDEDSTMARLLNHLKWRGTTEEFSLTHDEFDAALYALTGVGKQLREQELADEMNRCLAAKGYGDDYLAPQGYILLKEIPRNVVICHRAWQEFG